MSKHTPGPWVVDAYGDVTANGEDVARIASSDECAEHDARLIAAAPCMLAALEQIHAHGYTSSSDYDMVESAIAKAKGEA